MNELKTNYSMLTLSLDDEDSKEDSTPIQIQHESSKYISIGVCDKRSGECKSLLYLDNAQVRVLHAWLSTIV